MTKNNHSNINNSKKFILTFGYGNRKNYEVLATYINTYEVKFLVDIRNSPRAWSRQWYGEQIKKFCEEHHIQYFSKTALGNTSGKANWIPPNGEKASTALQEVADLVRQGTIVLLCAEMDHNRCHRTEVANQLEELVSIPVKHLS